MRRCTEVVWRRAPGFLAVSREGRDVTVVQGPAADIWSLLDRDTTMDEVVTTLADRYQAPSEVVRGDVESLVDLLVDQGYVQTADGT